MLKSAQNWKKNALFQKIKDNNSGNMETRQMAPSFHLLSLLCLWHSFLFLKIVKIHFHVFPLYSVLVCKTSRFQAKAIDSAVLYPAVLGGTCFSTIIAIKTVVQLGSLEGALHAIPSGVQEQSPRKFWLFCILSSWKHPSRHSTYCGTSVCKVNCLFFDELIFTLLGVWGS